MQVSFFRNYLKFFHCYQHVRFNSLLQGNRSVLNDIPSYIALCPELTEENVDLANNLINSMVVIPNFLSEIDENSILAEIEPYLRKMRYEFDHWDNAIHGFRETERLKWNETNTEILNRVRKLAFPPNVAQLRFVHILDLDKNGYIKPHIDAVRFCGDTIAGLSLLTDSVMRLVNDKNKNLCADILLKRRSLYIMKNFARFDYTHEILSNERSVFKGEKIFKDRRISVICRNEPDPAYKT
ncbi:alpha-ketoglutarate-dependent dioxygenase alkB homolog 7, mitochondrial isoform X1 [Diorhabda carinulata]|uniref:alpha-ketoglutarate-dependent dioxygenase alkB homolog 7, mitochondrial isoform X1 n=1 Tax=Diorhabda carinulata TaxID=1163345 RepID=UPI0025A14EC1|nr:alpha-ketoglutarate-dependent dioxygenase alkB homolog 7, mitochondrial isoform X1 [Diorhabda carinulata]